MFGFLRKKDKKNIEADENKKLQETLEKAGVADKPAPDGKDPLRKKKR